LVFVVDGEGRPLAPCHPARAREILDKGAAVVDETCPFAIRLVRFVPEGVAVEVDLKVDTGAKHHGIALVVASGECLLWGQVDLRTDIKERLDWRRISRRGRRGRKTRYRKPRFDNRKRPEGWLPPSLRHRVDVLVKVARRLSRYVKIRRIVAETASFDLHRMMNPEVHGEGYQKGPLFRTDLRRYLFMKHRGTCAYCRKDLIPGWQADHVQPKSRGGSDRARNRVAACEACNVKKSNRTAEEFGHPEVIEVAKENYAPAAIVTSIKTVLVRELSRIAPVVETDGALTSRNRRGASLEKSHAVDALCALEVPKDVRVPSVQVRLVARAAGSRRLVNGVRGEHRIRLGREVKGFRQWDEVSWNGRRCYVKGRRKTGSFLLSDLDGRKAKDGVGWRRLTLMRRSGTLQGIYVKACV
jgi:5-methylcytosine-specific restriction endonuclease McrA